MLLSANEIIGRIKEAVMQHSMGIIDTDKMKRIVSAEVINLEVALGR